MSVNPVTIAHWEARHRPADLDAELGRKHLAPATASSAELAFVDQLHVGQHAALVAFAAWVGLPASGRVLDLGSGLGGPARFLVRESPALAVIALEPSALLDAQARELTRAAGLDPRIVHRQGTLADLSDDASFDLVWIEHVDMHLADKIGTYGALARRLRDGGRVVWHDWLRGPAGDPGYPLFWSADGGGSHLVPRAAFDQALAAAGLVLGRHEPIPERTLGWLATTRRALVAARERCAPDEQRLRRLTGLLEETDNAAAAIRDERLVPHFSEARLSR